MLTQELIKRELDGIRYYYGRKELFDSAFAGVGTNAIIATVERYNQAICLAPPKIYEMYVCLYVKCCTYDGAAEELGYSTNYVYKTNKKIVDFFYQAFGKEAA